MQYTPRKFSERGALLVAAQSGTDDRSFGYGGTGMKSHANKFEPYGKLHEGSEGR